MGETYFHVNIAFSDRDLIEAAKRVYRQHHKLDDTEKISDRKIFMRSIKYYVEN